MKRWCLFRLVEVVGKPATVTTLARTVIIIDTQAPRTEEIYTWTAQVEVGVIVQRIMGSVLLITF